MAELIPCLSVLMIRPSSPWPQFEAQRSKASAPTTHQESGFHALEAPDAPIPLFEDADPIPLSIDDVGEEDESEESLEEEDALEIRPPLPFDELDFDLIDPVIVAEISGLDGFRSYYGQVRTITELMWSANVCFRIISSVFHLSKGALSQTDKRALGCHRPRGRSSILTVAQIEFLQMVIGE
jgi:hypothetical protein